MTTPIVHCSDTPNGRPHTAADIHKWHKDRGWDGIGYHYVIHLNGEIEAGRPPYWTGAHCKGQNNRIGICLIGRNKFTAEQANSLTHLLHQLGCSATKVPQGHYEFDSGKTCPNFDVSAWWRNEIDWPLLGKK